MEEFLLKWNEIKERLRVEYRLLDVSYNTWILPLTVHEVTSDTVTICVPADLSNSGAGVKYIKTKYELLLKECIAEVLNKEYNIIFVSEEEVKNKNLSSYNNGSILKNTNEIVLNKNRVKAEKANLNSKYTFDTFVVGENNRFAHSAALAVAESPGMVYNPLFIWGGPGLGKTHLMHSIGHYIINNNPDLNVLYVTSETFLNEVIESIRSGNQAMIRFREKYRNIDVLLLDDVQLIIGKESTQEEFFNTFNELHSSNKAIIISSDKPPKNMETLEERLKSRFEWGITADIKPPNYETRMAILRKNAETAGCDIDDDIIQYIATNIKSNIRVLEGAFNKVVALSNLNRDEKITISTAEEAIRDIITPDEIRRITPELILDTVSNYYGISKDEIISKKRKNDVVIPRQVVMYLCDSLTDSSTVAIGNFLGGRDHATVLYGCNKIKDELKKDEYLINSIETIKKILNPSVN